MLAGLGLWRALCISRISSVAIRNESSSTEMGSVRCFVLLRDPSRVRPSSGLNHAPSYNAWALCSQEENLAVTLSRRLDSRDVHFLHPRAIAPLGSSVPYGFPAQLPHWGGYALLWASRRHSEQCYGSGEQAS